MPPRAGNVSMNSGKLYAALGGNPFQPWPVGEELLPTDREWHFTRPMDELGGAGWLAERLYRVCRGERDNLGSRNNWNVKGLQSARKLACLGPNLSAAG